MTDHLRRIKSMARNWSGPELQDLSTILTRNEYLPTIADRHYGATAPLEPRSCRCELPGFNFDPDDDEVHCWKCGAKPPTTTT